MEIKTKHTRKATELDKYFIVDVKIDDLEFQIGWVDKTFNGLKIRKELQKIFNSKLKFTKLVAKKEVSKEIYLEFKLAQ